jgi:fatty-acyl-CoA synthase
VPAPLVSQAKEALQCQFTILFGQTEMHDVVSQTRITDSPWNKWPRSGSHCHSLR